ncbi:MAG TPA: tetratricopeptide repeat protein [Planctomycetota bacterium]|nr:tetratricopeptide repeat protein [Planctomycetota bacterium]
MSLKRKLLVSAAIAVPSLVLLAAFLLSSPMMGWYQKRIDRDPATVFSRDLEMWTADLCLMTWRPEEAAPRYRLYYERYTKDFRRAHALLRYGLSLEEAGRSADAIDIYEKYLAEYPDHEEKTEAEIGINRIKNSRR